MRLSIDFKKIKNKIGRYAIMKENVIIGMVKYYPIDDALIEIWQYVSGFTLSQKSNSFGILSDRALSFKAPDSRYSLLSMNFTTILDSTLINFDFPDEETALYFKLKYCS